MIVNFFVAVAVVGFAAVSAIAVIALVLWLAKPGDAQR